MKPDRDRTLIARTAAALWAAIGLAGFIASATPVGAGSEYVEGMRVAAIVATVFAMVCFASSSWRPLGRAFYIVMLPLMTIDIGALYYLSGTLRGEIALLFTFVIVFAAYFFDWKVIGTQLALIGVALAIRLAVLGLNDVPTAEIVRFWMLFPALVMIAWLVSFLRTKVDQHEESLLEHKNQDATTGLLSAAGFEPKLVAELELMARHERPLTLLVLEPQGVVAADLATEAGLTRSIGRTIVGQIGPHDYCARLSAMRFAVLVSDTDSDGGAKLQADLVDAVNKRLTALGQDAGRVQVVVGQATFPDDAGTAEDMMEACQASMRPFAPLRTAQRLADLSGLDARAAS
jgi:GGDEF domain-containing protein